MKSQTNPGTFLELFRNSWYFGSRVFKDRPWPIIFRSLIFIIVSLSPFLISGSTAILLNELIEAPQGGYLTDSLFLALGVFILAGFIPAIFYNLDSYASRILWLFSEEKFTLMILKKSGEIDIPSQEDPSVRDLFNKISENQWRILNFLDRNFFILQNIAEALIASIVVLYFKWWVLVLVLAVTVPELFVEIKYGQEIWGIHSSRAEIRRKYWDLKYLFQQVSSIIELKLYQNTVYFYEIIRDLFKSFKQEELKKDKKKLFLQLISKCLSQIGISIAILWFIYEVIKGNILVGTLTFIIASIGNLRGSMSSVFRNLGNQYQDSLFMTDIRDFLSLKAKIKRPDKEIKIDPNTAPEIIFEHVSFNYPGSSNKIFENLSLKISPGEKLALIGINGAGKTTFVKLLCRFYDPIDGRILINGYDLREIDLESWYKILGVLLQDYSNYHLTVQEAIVVGRTAGKTDLEKVQSAAKAAEADQFIEEWNKKYEQPLGKIFSEGVEPSIGQWQKLALARVFYRDPKVLILDEPTSSIDAEAEANIFGKLESIKDNRTLILISHRFSTVRNANKIIVIGDGGVKESGTHDELMGLNGTYAKLFNLQAKGYRE